MKAVFCSLALLFATSTFAQDGIQENLNSQFTSGDITIRENSVVLTFHALSIADSVPGKIQVLDDKMKVLAEGDFKVSLPDQPKSFFCDLEIRDIGKVTLNQLMAYKFAFIEADQEKPAYVAPISYLSLSFKFEKQAH